MANYDSNYAIAQLISARLGNSPIPFDSVYSICLLIYQELGGVEQDFDSVYSILLEILPLIDGGIASKVIDDTSIRYDRTWSSHKIASELADAGFDIEIVTELPSVGDPHTIYFILKQDSSTGDYYDEWMYINNSWEKVGNTAIDLSDYATIDYVDEQIEAVIGAANSEIEGKQTEDFTFVQTLPVSGEEDQLVIIKGDNTDTLYKYVSGAWVEQTPDANKLYFDVENEALYSYVTANHQFAPVSLVNTIVVGSNLNNNADLKALKTPGVYSVVQRLHNATKGDYVKNWTLYVESVDYEEYDRSDSVYQRLVSNYTIQKRTWSATRASNDGWSNFSTYYAGEIKDSTVSKYYTWSSSKLNASLGAKQDVLSSGENISIENNKVNALGYLYNENLHSFIESVVTTTTFLQDTIDPSDVGLNDLELSGAAGVTTYSYSGTSAADFSDMGPMLTGVGIQIGNNIGFIQSVDTTNQTVTLDATLNANNAIQNQVVTAFIQKLPVLISGAANSSIYNLNDAASSGIIDGLSTNVNANLKISVGNYPIADVVSVDVSNNTITLKTTLDSSNAVTNAYLNSVSYTNNAAVGQYSHSEGSDTAAIGDYSHVEGYHTKASDEGAHAEGYNTIASGYASHAEGEETIASVYTSHTEGYQTLASGICAHAEGRGNIASNYAAHAEGYRTIASGQGAHAEGFGNSQHLNTASGDYSHVEGAVTTAQNSNEHAEGSCNRSHKNSNTYGDSGNTLHSVGFGTSTSNTKNAHEIMQNADMYIYGIGGYQGTDTKVQNASIMTVQEVINSKADVADLSSYATLAYVDSSLALKADKSYVDSSLALKQNLLSAGQNISIDASNAISVDGYVFDSSNYSFATKYLNEEDEQNLYIATNTATGLSAVAEGIQTTATGDAAHAEGAYGTLASGNYSHAEGGATQATNSGSHAEGQETVASGKYSHAEGNLSVASGKSAHAEGGRLKNQNPTTAAGNQSHAEGGSTLASGQSSHAEGELTEAKNGSEHAQGQCNVSHKNSDTYGDAGNTMDSIGIGYILNKVPQRKNATEVMENGDMYLIGVGGYQGIDTKVQDATVQTLQDVVNGKADAYEVATTADVDAIFNNPAPNEIYYTSSDSNIVTPSTTSALPTIVSNTYYSKGKIKFASELISIGNRAFRSRTNLTSVTIPNSVTSIGEEAFDNCSGINSVTIGNSVTHINYQSFSGCSFISVNIPNSVTSIGEEAFSVCRQLTSVTIGNNVTSIGLRAFWECSRLTDIVYNGTISEWNNITFGNYWHENAPATVVHCTDGDVSI